jgi:hypothetical protein
VGVVTKFSVRNPEHELRLAELLAPYVERVFMGHPLSGILSFPRRIATTYLNAAVYPVHRDFFMAVQETLSHKGIVVPIRILKADGGNMNFEASIDYPAQTIFSGPAASVMGSIAFAPEEGETLVFDIGGTTTDMAVLIDQVPLLDPLGVELGEFKTLIRALKTHSVGLGGDSAVRVANGTILVGPERQGPALALGGPAPTPTDALVILGKTKWGDPTLARRGFTPLAAQLGLSLEAAAEAVFDRTCRLILAEADAMIRRINSQPVYTVHEMQEGRQIKPTTLLVLGGPAPLFAERLERLSSFKVGVVPRWEVANALGAALARTTSEVILYADTQRRIEPGALVFFPAFDWAISPTHPRTGGAAALHPGPVPGGGDLRHRKASGSTGPISPRPWTWPGYTSASRTSRASSPNRTWSARAEPCASPGCPGRRAGQGLRPGPPARAPRHEGGPRRQGVLQHQHRSDHARMDREPTGCGAWPSWTPTAITATAPRTSTGTTRTPSSSPCTRTAGPSIRARAFPRVRAAQGRRPDDHQHAPAAGTSDKGFLHVIENTWSCRSSRTSNRTW